VLAYIRTGSSNASNIANIVEFDRIQMPPVSHVVLTRSAEQRHSENRGSQLLILDGPANGSGLYLPEYKFDLRVCDKDH
jgi:hypothetical protein